jgi:hypothetical protein
VFGDIHGLSYWKDAVAENPDYRFLFLGDYLDPYKNIPHNVLIDNLKEIIQLKRNRGDEVILLLGNHDLHYLFLDIYPCCRFDDEIEEAAHALFSENKHLFKYAFQEENYIFTHAGISEKWFFDDFGGDPKKNIADQLNNHDRDQRPALFRCGALRGGDRSAIGGILWADIDELNDPLPRYTQIVGHNRVGKIFKRNIKGGEIVFCDCLYNKVCLKLK